MKAVKDKELIVFTGAQIRALRHRAGVTQGVLSEELGVRRVTVMHWEGGKYKPARMAITLLNMWANEQFSSSEIKKIIAGVK